MELILKEEIKKLKNVEGQIRGIGLKDILDFIIKEEGQKGLRELEEMVASLGYPLKYKDIKKMNFYPLILLLVFFLVIKKLFNYNKEKFEEMGRYCSKSSAIMRLFMRYLVSIDKVVEQASIMYGKYFTTGSLKIVEYNKEKRYVIGRIESLIFYPSQYYYLTGYFSSVVEMVTKSSVTCEETSVYKDSKYHDFLLKW